MVYGIGACGRSCVLKAYWSGDSHNVAERREGDANQRLFSIEIRMYSCAWKDSASPSFYRSLLSSILKTSLTGAHNELSLYRVILCSHVFMNPVFVRYRSILYLSHFVVFLCILLLFSVGTRAYPPCLTVLTLPV